jgi:hypothetical protein
MSKDLYPIDQATDDGLSYEFTSVGPVPIVGKPRLVRKRILYSPFPGNPFGYNLGFGDINPYNPEIVLDQTASDNGDMRKVLNTVFKTMYGFFDRYTNPRTFVYIQGAEREAPHPEAPLPAGRRSKQVDAAIRIRLYQRMIFDQYEELKTDFRIIALLEQGWTPLNSELVKNLLVRSQAFIFIRIR